jgi:hypothetical protein
MVTHTLSPPEPPAKPLIIGNKLKAELRREIAHLTAEWKTTICADRKRELERQITALLAMKAARRPRAAMPARPPLTKPNNGSSSAWLTTNLADVAKQSNQGAVGGLA